LPSTWQELLLEEDKGLTRREERRGEGLQEIAWKVSKNKIKGIFDKDILVYENERVVLLVDGAVQRILGAGVYTVGGLINDVKTGAILSRIKLGHAENVDVVFINLSDIDLKWGLLDLWTQDGTKLPGANGQIRLKVAEADAGKLFANMMDMTTPRITQNDLFNRIRLELLGSVIAPTIKTQRIDDLWGNKTVIEDCYNGIETGMRKTLSRWGFELIQFTIDFKFPDDWIKWKEQISGRPRQIDQIKFPREIRRAEIVADYDLTLLQKQQRDEAGLLDKKYDLDAQQYDLAKDQNKFSHDLAKDQSEFAQGLDMKRQLDKLKLDRETGEVQVRQSERDMVHKRVIENVRAEQEGRAQTLQILAGTGAPETIVKALEAETLQKIAAHGGASEAASAIAARYNLEIHEKSEAAAFKTASDLVGVAKTPPPQPIVITPSPSPVIVPSSPPVQTTKLIQEMPPGRTAELGKTCSKCNAQNPGVAKFCISCGEKL